MSFWQSLSLSKSVIHEASTTIKLVGFTVLFWIHTALCLHLCSDWLALLVLLELVLLHVTLGIIVEQSLLAWQHGRLSSRESASLFAKYVDTFSAARGATSVKFCPPRPDSCVEEDCQCFTWLNSRQHLHTSSFRGTYLFDSVTAEEVQREQFECSSTYNVTITPPAAS